jgi:hypothetical protein
VHFEPPITTTHSGFSGSFLSHLSLSFILFPTWPCYFLALRSVSSSSNKSITTFYFNSSSAHLATCPSLDIFLLCTRLIALVFAVDFLIRVYEGWWRKTSSLVSFLNVEGLCKNIYKMHTVGDWGAFPLSSLILAALGQHNKPTMDEFILMPPPAPRFKRPALFQYHQRASLTRDRQWQQCSQTDGWFSISRIVLHLHAVITLLTCSYPFFNFHAALRKVATLQAI